ncbi:MAG: S8 family serine peptidase [Jaaginema sp. PMC 1078.18]|nr:S8 family serine peptidase [Jaaginema sp. PMC 1078.18]
MDNPVELDLEIDAISPEIPNLGDEDMDFIPFIPNDILEQFESGVFTVGETGEIEIDYLYDGGGYQGELAIFSLEGIEEYDLGSREFIQEAARRALGNDPDAVGQVVISDINEGAKLEGRYLAEGNFNRGEYQGTTKVSFNSGERFAFMLVPNGTVQQVYDGLNGSNSELAKSLRPLFSLSTANPEDGLSLGQIADVTGDGHTFVMEDLRVDGWTDEDYNDIIFQVKGATGKAIALDEVIDPDLDWRETQLGEDLYAAITPDVPELPVDPVTGAEYIPGQLLVKFDADLSDAEVKTLAESYGATEFERLIPEDPDADFALEQWRLLNFDPDSDVVAIRDAIAQETGVVASELNGVRSLHWQPDDTHFGDLWGLHNANDADIDAPEAWDIQRGSKDVVVAVIDTGVDYTHPDLAANMWRNPGEIAGDGIDNDGNKLIDDVYGYDFGNMDNDPKPDYLPLFLGYDPDYGHGTHVAGTIGAVGNNDLGVVGVSPNVSLMALNARNSPHGLSVDATIRAIHYAVNHGADIINGSFGKEFYLESDYDALSYANDHDVLFVASAGNDGKNNDIYGQYPASYNLPNIISVAATDSNDNLAAVHSDGGLSNYGLNTVDLGAPGRSILSTLPNNKYGYATGTSMAAPHVAGAAALLLAENPTWSATDLKAAILAGVDKKDSLKGITVSGGRLNLHTPLQQGLPPNTPPTVTLEVLDGEASEDGNAAHLLVQLDEAGDRDVTVYYTLDGTAKNAEDYLELSGEITIPAGAKQARIPVVSLHDYEAEASETIEVSLKSDANYNIGTNNKATITIENSTKTHRYGPFVYVNPQNGHQYLMTEEDTWHGAQAQAEALGGNLVSINSQDENDWLFKAFNRRRRWIGLNDSEIYGNSEGNYRWVNGEELTFTPSMFRTDNVANTPAGEDFFETNFMTVGGWNDMPNDLEPLGSTWNNPVGIVEIDPETLSQPIVNVMVTDSEAGEDGNAGHIVITRVGKLDKDLTINYSLSGDAVNGVDYKRLTGEITIPAGETLVTLPIQALTDLELENTEKVILNLDSGDYNFGTYRQAEITIEDRHPLNRISNEVLGRDLLFLDDWTAQWRAGATFAQLRKSFIASAHDGQGNYEAENKIREIYQDVLQREATTQEVSDGRTQLENGATLSEIRQELLGFSSFINTLNAIYINPETGNQYFVTTPDTWLGAQEQAKALGGNLVTINNEAEAQWLIDTFEAQVSWHGLHDSPIYGAYEGEYQWINGEPVTYTNWRTGEPNNQFHTVIRYSEGEDFMHYFPNGVWNDLPPDGYLLRDTRGIVEISNSSGQFLTLDTPYLSFDDSPFKDVSFTDFHLETFEDGQLNSLGVQVSQGIVISGSDATDSVDSDDGFIEGLGKAGHSLYAVGAPNLTMTFDPQNLGYLPTHAGFALTDLGKNDLTSAASGTVIFEAFDNNGNSLGTRTINYGDNSWDGGTDEDRFLGVIHNQGISRLEISSPDGNRGYEIDHIQYGLAENISLTNSSIANINLIQTYFGEDLNTQGIPLNTTPNTDAAKADFLASLENAQIVDFDNYSIGDRPTTLNFGNTQATLSGDLRVDAESNSVGNSLFSYNDMAFSIEFDSPQSAFGMTIHDAEDKPLYMTVYHTDGTTRKFAIPVQAVYPENSDSALFYGITDRVPFDKVTVHKRATTENLRLDDLVIGVIKA